MPRVFMSSGEMIADRRFDYGRDLEARGDLQGAVDLFMQAIECAPGFVSAWFALGDVRERLGDREGAIAAFARAQTPDGADLLGAALRLMRLTGTGLAPMPPHYVTALYDQYAPTFEQSLVGELGYRGPDLLLAAVSAACAAKARPMHFRRAVDLGCGTGLAARAFRDLVAEFAGFDLSAGMIRQAQASGQYASLQVTDAVDGLRAEADASADLVLAADMMIYLYDLAPLFGEVARVLAPDGLFAFTAETHAGKGVTLGPGLRYAQSEAHLRGLLADAGLALDRVDAASIRTEKDIPVPSLVMVASKG
ncbi:MAG: methyltransferase domain-containing protein [Tardiphaga sp.]